VSDLVVADCIEFGKMLMLSGIEEQQCRTLPGGAVEVSYGFEGGPVVGVSTHTSSGCAHAVLSVGGAIACAEYVLIAEARLGAMR